MPKRSKKGKERLINEFIEWCANGDFLDEKYHSEIQVSDIVIEGAKKLKRKLKEADSES